ncbi:MAG: glycosyltransferase [Pseudomonadota bacterium]
MSGPPITVLMATLNGAAHLEAQLQSLTRQTLPWRLWVSDDGSTDATRALLHRFAARHPVRVLEGPRMDLAGANFMKALHHPDLPPGPVAFCDQDDLWLPHRLEDGMRALQGFGGPAIACAPVQPVDARARPLGPPLPTFEPCFETALAQNTLAGAAMTLNAAALAALRADPLPPPLPFHDWYIALRASAAGWPIRIAPRPGLLYRQHGDNLLGLRRGPRRRLRQARQLWDGTWTGWRDATLDALLALPEGRIPPEARTSAHALRHDRARLRAWTQSGARRRNPLEQSLLRVLAGLARV